MGTPGSRAGEVNGSHGAAASAPTERGTTEGAGDAPAVGAVESKAAASATAAPPPVSRAREAARVRLMVTPRGRADENGSVLTEPPGADSRQWKGPQVGTRRSQHLRNPDVKEPDGPADP
ncbi:hypothetical protein GCM10023168_35370 [Fodinibacter luteus]|uniref:Uncharacterized protein n=1 Tax=Fodinibacter luteus TaxID=552064 RepID=A0ABP8KRV4_9MICO